MRRGLVVLAACLAIPVGIASATRARTADSCPPGTTNTDYCQTAEPGTRGVTQIGSANDDVQTGSAGNDVQRGGGGNDTQIGGRGNDRQYGGAGNDTQSGGSGNDFQSGGAGNDLMNGGSGRDRQRGGSGLDVINGGSGNDRIDGGSGNDALNGGSGADTIVGGKGSDAINGDGVNAIAARVAVASRRHSRAGNDVIYAQDGRRDKVNCGGGRHDRVYADRKDRLSHCETVIYKKHKAPRI